MAERKLTFIKRIHTRFYGDRFDHRDRWTAIKWDPQNEVELEVLRIGHIDDLRRNALNNAF